jgi:hypothetical protein
MSINFNPLPEQEQNQLLIAVRDMLNNGGRIPQDVSNNLIIAAIIELNGCIKRNANLSRRNANGIKLLGIGIVVMVLFMVYWHGGDTGILKMLASWIGL